MLCVCNQISVYMFQPKALASRSHYISQLTCKNEIKNKKNIKNILQKQKAQP